TGESAQSADHLIRVAICEDLSDLVKHDEVAKCAEPIARVCGSLEVPRFGIPSCKPSRVAESSEESGMASARPFSEDVVPHFSFVGGIDAHPLTLDAALKGLAANGQPRAAPCP